MEFGRIPHDIEVYELGPSGRLQRLLQANWADILDERNWMLHGVEEKILGADSIQYRTLDTLEWESFLSPDQLSALITPAHALSSTDLYRYIRKTEGSGLNTRQYETIFWRQLSVPLRDARDDLAWFAIRYRIGAYTFHGFSHRFGRIGGHRLLFTRTDHWTLSLILEIPAATSGAYAECTGVGCRADRS